MTREVRDPPVRLGSLLRQLGPGLIIAGAIVGSGELIATTKVGAEAGFSLLWLIIAGCVIKVFTQVELGRYTVIHQKTTLGALDELPGPRVGAGWAVWAWLAMTLLGIAQMGGIVGGVGQALAIAVPLTEEGRALNVIEEDLVDARVDLGLARHRAAPAAPDPAVVARLEGDVRSLQATLDEIGPGPDPAWWSALLALVTVALLVVGRYGFVQTVATFFVGLFTLVTVLTVVLLQLQPEWAATPSELAGGLSFDLPRSGGASAPVGTALAAFGIIGVGASELIMYPYWCLEKGYARWAGPTEDSDAWRRRARGWVRVMRVDAWVSMVVYTFATVAFYLLGAAVLGRTGLNPEGSQLVRTLAQMYVPVFGTWAPPLFLFGAFCVLYSTFFVASAGYARVAADAVGVMRGRRQTEARRRFWVRAFCVVVPLLSLLVFLFVRAPAQLVLASGVAQALMLPVLGSAALYFRYRRTPRALRPGRIWDALLWASCAGFCVVGGWTVISRLGLV